MMMEDPDFQAVDSEQVSTVEERALFFRLFHSDESQMSAGERQEYARFLPSQMTSQAERNYNSDTAAYEANGNPAPTPLRFLAFMNDYRREIRGELEKGIFPSEGDAVVSARVVDEFGQPQRDLLVYLYEYDEESGKIKLVGYERTDSGGVVVFDSLEPNRFYRAETISSSDQVARSTIRLADKNSATVLPPMVLRKSGESVSGFVFLDEDPAIGTMVSAIPIHGGPTLKTTTDKMGYFSLAPLPDGDVELVFERSAIPLPLRGTMLLTDRGGELFVPLGLLSEDAK
ncbi:carboxypeptidase-like regulatory domain-containing protein [bacterium]|nr:carboxypeptidase-like regulatory domain-containing protein [bacterium]